MKTGALPVFNNDSFFVLFFLWIIYLCQISPVFANQQYFRLRPRDVQIVEGHTVLLHCHVGNRAGQVQWAKDGFLLGFDPLIPGFPRYTMVFDDKRSIYNLKIRDVQLEDEGEFQCQVGPAPGNIPIRTKAQVTVLVPPRETEIRHLGEGRVVEVKEAERVALTCSAHDSKPAAHLKWYRNGAELDSNLYITEVKHSGKYHRTAVSSITLYPKLDDNGAIYACEASHAALQKPVKSSVSINVLYPPGQPVIEGYHEGDVVQAGDTLTLACISMGGNPPARLVWYKNEVEVDVTYSTSGREATNIHTFTVEPTDNEAVYKCVASSVVTSLPMDTSVELNVLFAPTDVKIFGPAEARSGDTITITCVTGPSNPPVSIAWVVDGARTQPTGNGKEKVAGGWMTSSNVSVTISRQESVTKTFHCMAVSETLGQTVAETATVAVIYPPNLPLIEDSKEGMILHAGDQHTLLCATSGGNPAANLRWFKGDTPLETPVQVDRGKVSSELHIKLDESDNNAAYRCEATNAATSKPLAVNHTLQVYFPPASVSIRTSPKSPKSGEAVTIICESSSSHPESVIQWWKDGVALVGQHDVVADGQHGGKSTRSLYHLNVTDADDKSVITCRATNLVLQRSVHDSVVLSVQYKPDFLIPMSTSVEFLEGDSALINATARGNPKVLSYVWIKDGIEVVTEEARFDPNKPWARDLIPRGPVLEFKTVNRLHAGEFTCEASNTVGSSRVKIIVSVIYSAGITNLTNSAHVSESQDAIFECRATANPVTKDLFEWQRADGSALKEEDSVTNKMEILTHLGHSVLTIRNVTRQDAGYYFCTVYNGLGERDKKPAALFVKFAPKIKVDASALSVAADLGETAALSCVSEGFPAVRFYWYHDEKLINGTTQLSKYALQLSQLKNATWESVLYVSDVQKDDLGFYICVAQNELGEHREQIHLRQKARPDIPTGLTVSNVTHKSAVIRWIPGFGGGLQQYFRVRYRQFSAKDYIYRDVFPANVSYYTVNDLLPETKYVFWVMARNALGDSDYSKEDVVTETLEAPPSKNGNYPKEVDKKGNDISWTTLTAISSVGVFLLLLNVALVICFVKRKRARQRAKDKEESSRKEKSDSAMYTPNKYHETINGEALFPLAEKPATRSGSTDAPIEENGRKHKKMNGNLPSKNNAQCIEIPTVPPKIGSSSNHKQENFPDVIKIRRRSLKDSVMGTDGSAKDMQRSQSHNQDSLREDPSDYSLDAAPVQLNTLDRKRKQRLSANEDGRVAADLMVHAPEAGSGPPMSHPVHPTSHPVLPIHPNRLSTGSTVIGRIGSHAV